MDCTWVRCGSIVGLTKAHLRATLNPVAIGLDTGVVGKAFQEHFGSPCTRRHLE